MKDRRRSFRRYDTCPICGPIDFICTEYISEGQIFLYEEQCPKCGDFWQIGLDDTLDNCRKFVSKDMI
jgi:uncharacterized Zn finger protein